METSNQKYKNFQFSSSENSELLKDKKKMRQLLHNKLKNVSQDSCFHELMTGKSAKKINKLNDKLPASIIQQAEKFTNLNKNKISVNELVEKFTTSIYLTSEEINSIERVTRDQSKFSHWFEQRKGRLTASSFGRIAKRMKTIKENPSETPES